MSPQTVRSGATGDRMLCCWSDCTRFGFHNYEHVQREGQRSVHYLFCGERHRSYWRNSHRSNNNLPSGSHSLPAPR